MKASRVHGSKREFLKHLMKKCVEVQESDVEESRDNERKKTRCSVDQNYIKKIMQSRECVVKVRKRRKKCKEENKKKQEKIERKLEEGRNNEKRKEIVFYLILLYFTNAKV